MKNLNKYIALFCLIVFTTTINAQENCSPKYNRKSRQLLVIADSLSSNGSTKALSYYKKALKEDTLNIDARFNIAKIYFDKLILSKYDVLLSSYTEFYENKTEDYFLKCVDQCEMHNDFTGYYYLGTLYYFKKEYNLSSFFLKEFLKHSSPNMFGYNQAQKYYQECQKWKEWNNKTVDISSYVVTGINSNDDEEFPHISHDGQLMFFFKTYQKTEKTSLTSQLVTELFCSYVEGIDTVNNWIYNLGKPLFSLENKHIESISLSRNKDTAYLAVCEKIRLEDKYITDCDIYYSIYDNGEWLEPYPLEGSINNKNTYEGYPCISADGNTLFYSSNGTESIGGLDIFYCRKNSNGNWTSPVNMGVKINTLNDEISPFINYSNDILYFSSNGKFGFGGFDIFYTTKKANIWEEPINIGKPYNDSDNNKNFVTDARNLSGYFSSKNNTTWGGYDILTAPVPNQLKSNQKMIINIKLEYNNNENLEDIVLNVKDTKTNQSIPLVKSNNKGYYSAIIDIDKSVFLLRLENSEYIYCNRIIQANNNYIDFKTINIKPIKNFTKFQIEDLKIKTANEELSTNEILIINDFANYLKRNNIKIKIITYLYSVTFEETDIENANELGNLVKSALLRNGVAENRIVCESIDLFISKDHTRKNIEFEIIK